MSATIPAAVQKRMEQQRREAEQMEQQRHEGEFDDVRTAAGVMAATLVAAPYCVPERVPSGLVLLTGRPKSKKSWCALQLALAKSGGGDFMGMPSGEACTVLALFLEDNDPRMRKRLEFFGLSPETAPKNLFFGYEWPTGLEGIEKLERWVQKHPETRLIIVDVLQRFRGPRERNASAYEADYLTMSMLHGVAQRHPGLTVMVVHHVKKGAVDDPIEAISGTFGIAGAADAYMILRRGEGETWTVHIDGRDWDRWENEFSWEFKQGVGWVQLGEAGVSLTDTQREILDFAKDMGYATPTAVAEIRKISKSSAHEALLALVRKGVLRVQAGKYYPC